MLRYIKVSSHFIGVYVCFAIVPGAAFTKACGTLVTLQNRSSRLDNEQLGQPASPKSASIRKLPVGLTFVNCRAAHFCYDQKLLHYRL
jgi:hypothetical protein